jgi:hypothetical protein
MLPPLQPSLQADADGALALPAKPALGLAGIAGLVCGLVPFILSVSSTHIVKIDGVTSAIYRDWVALGGAAGAILFALVCAASLREPSLTVRTRPILAIVGIVALGLVQLLRGLGKI